ncbi:helix-turn-helix domain-containing protein [Sphingomonas aerolata]|uniref:helix-turn-helix domain-containing protein n=1 Tax=Sphingomonas aerolata TaxID=185951 RepID=UPI00208E0E7D|nr:helix-turn-helix transcriptional regulator [Sphingomonas aerolata]USR00120.1 helix-turn-helix domain-containing protein [Sphingomonas aerolata]
MFSSGLRRTAQVQGISQREIAKALGYKQSVVLSHMALGRVPIPVERAAQFAKHLNLDAKAFLAAVLKQRYPDIDWSTSLRGDDADLESTHLVQSIEAIACRPIEQLAPEQMRVIREVAADPHAERRWLTVHEVRAIELLRRHVPLLARDGLSKEEEGAIEEAINAKRVL